MRLLSEWDALPDHLKSSLLFLRLTRDALSRELRDELTWYKDDKIANDLIEDVASYRQMGSFYKIKGHLKDHAQYTVLEQLDVLKKVVLRIARLEREMCRYQIYDKELENA